LNGKKNGKCKEYLYDGTLEFEGNYAEGKKNGKGKKYYQDGKLKYKGEYLNGKKNGVGKEYYNNKLLFEGEYKNGRRWNGKSYDNDNNIMHDIKNGSGYFKIYTKFSILVFEGDYINGKRNGKGKEYDYDQGKLIFEGEYKNREKNGKGKEYYYDRKIAFEGEYKNGKRHGKGKEYNYNGQIEFEGEFINGKRNVEPIYLYPKTDYINVIFSCSNGRSFSCCCQGDEEICEIIKKYRNKANDYDKNSQFLFNGRVLSNNSSSLIDNRIYN